MYRWLLLILAACGRIDFDALADGTTPTLLQVGNAAPAYAQTWSLPIELTEGSTVIVAGAWNDSAETVTITSTAISAWTALPRQSIAAGCGSPAFGTNARIWVGTVETSTADTITLSQATTGTGHPLGAYVLEYRGLGAIDGTAGETATAPSNAVAAGTLTPTGRDLVVAEFHDSQGTGEMKAGPNFEQLGIETDGYSLVESAIVDASTTVTPTATLPAGRSDACWVGVSIALHISL